MQRQAISLEARADRQNLDRATWKAARGKSRRPAVARLLGDLDARLEQLAGDNLAERAPLGRASRFTILDPKRRTIHAACFSDRVLQHAILNLAEPRFERMLVDGCYACRPGQGRACRRVGGPARLAGVSVLRSSRYRRLFSLYPARAAARSARPAFQGRRFPAPARDSGRRFAV